MAPWSPPMARRLPCAAARPFLGLRPAMGIAASGRLDELSSLRHPRPSRPLPTAIGRCGIEARRHERRAETMNGLLLGLLAGPGGGPGGNMFQLRGSVGVV